MSDKKPFFYRLNAADFLAEIVTLPENQRADWVLRFALDLVSATHSTEFSQRLIEEARNYKEKKANAGKRGMQSRYNKEITEVNAAVTEANSVVTVLSSDITRNRNSNIKDNKNLSSSNNDEAIFYLTKKKRKLTGRRLESFNQFWQIFSYPKGKAEAADAWMDIPEITNTLFNRIINAAKSEASKRNEFIAQGKVPKMAQGWITGRRWEDDDMTTKPLISLVSDEHKRTLERLKAEGYE